MSLGPQNLHTTTFSIGTEQDIAAATQHLAGAQISPLQLALLALLLQAGWPAMRQVPASRA